jgi:predicted flap endonuclease-1-like 5' DNA nuclease
VVVAGLIALLRVVAVRRLARTKVEIERQGRWAPGEAQPGADRRARRGHVDAEFRRRRPRASPASAWRAPRPRPVPVDLPEADDLSLIKGLGPKLVEQLRALGVTRFAQIAAWDDAEIDRIDAQLGRFQGRIRRDDWPARRACSRGRHRRLRGKFGKL